MLPLLLAAALTVQDPLAARTLTPDRGPEIHVVEQAGPLVALRLSAPVPHGLPEGAVELLQELARPAAEATARELGARLELRHDGGRVVLAVTGPATAFDALAAILRRATGEPDLSVGSLRTARTRAEDRVLARLEQPASRIRRLLYHGLRGGPAPRGAAIRALNPESIRRLSDVVYRRARINVVLVGSVPDVMVRSAFSGWPASAGAAGAAGAAEADKAAGTVPDSAVTEARPQAHNEWGGIAFAVDAPPAVLAVAAELIQWRVTASALGRGWAEAWWEPAPALTLIGAASPADTVVRATARITDLAVRDSTAVPSTDVRRYLRRLIAETATLVDPDAVATARSAIRRRLLLEARTAAGRAEVVGRLTELDPEGSPTAYLERLSAVELVDVQALLHRVLETPAVAAEAR